MGSFAPTTRLATHEVLNQAPEWAGVNLFASDAALREAAAREGGDWVAAPLRELGDALDRDEVRTWATQANRHPPELLAFDRWGRRIDEVGFHPAYHALLTLAMQHRIAAVAWAEQRPGAHVAHAALLALFSEIEQGTMCPVSMTYAAVPALRHAPALAAEWELKVRASHYDAPLRPIAEKAGVMLGMAMTEKQGGSDLRATTTRAEPDGAGAARLTGHKWFCSAPMSDGFLTLAQAPGGLTCYLVPRIAPDGRRNALHLMRLKDKLGNRSNASAEIEYHAAYAEPVGEEGRGIATILTMVHHTRLDTMASTLGIMRRALVEAAHHAAHRSAFGQVLAAQPAMAAVLADLQLDYEAAAALTLRAARAIEGADAGERGLARLAVAVGKFWLTKRAPAFVVECMECLGGSGYVEESVLPRLYREAPVNAIWEGSGNVIALDTLRTLARDEAAATALLAECEAARGANHHLDAAVVAVKERFRTEPEARDARSLTEALATTLAGSLLVRFAPQAVSDAYCATRLGREHGHGFGTLPGSVDLMALLQRIGVSG